MNRKLAMGGIVALALGISAPALAGQTGQTGTKNQRTEHTMQTANQKASPKASPEARAAEWHQAEANSVRLSSLDRQQVRDVQAKLKDLGFYHGNVDGVLGMETRTALSHYYLDQLKLVQNGRIGDSSLTAFGFNQSEIQRVRGVDFQRGNERQPTRGTDQPAQQKPTQKNGQSGN